MTILLLSIIDILSTLFARIFINWWAPLFAMKVPEDLSWLERIGLFSSNGDLPRWLKYVGTFDDPINNGRPTYWSQVKWLYRNSAYGFSYYVLGAPFVPEDWVVHTFTGDEKDPHFTFYADTADGLFNLHCVRFGIRFKLGWKAWNYFDKSNQKWKSIPWGPLWRAPFVFSISKS